LVRQRCAHFESLGAVDGTQRPQNTQHTKNLDDVHRVASASDTHMHNNCQSSTHNQPAANDSCTASLWMLLSDNT